MYRGKSGTLLIDSIRASVGSVLRNDRQNKVACGTIFPSSTTDNTMEPERPHYNIIGFIERRWYPPGKLELDIKTSQCNNQNLLL